MRNLAVCYSENAIKVSDAYCIGPSSQADNLSQSLNPAIQEAVVCVHKVKLSNQKQFLIKITWCNPVGEGFTIGISDTQCSSKSSKHSRQLSKIKGTKSFELYDLKMELFWDLSKAVYDSGPEPNRGFYITFFANSELCLFLGDMEQESDVRKRIFGNTMAKSSLISRSEYFSGNAVYSTKAKFCENGTLHNISIKCIGEDRGGKNTVLCVSIDKKNVIQVKRLQWNFRGNQTLFVDGILVDMMWDVHDWFFNQRSGFAVFMFRTRSGLNSRLWLEEKLLESKEQDKFGFSLLMCACKNPD